MTVEHMVSEKKNHQPRHLFRWLSLLLLLALVLCVPLLSQAQEEAVVFNGDNFDEYIDYARANSGTALDALFAEYSETQGLVVTSPLSVSIMKDGDPMYDADFFSQVSALQPGETGVIESTGSLYLLQRVDITASDDDAFEAYRDEVLYREKMADVEQRVATLGEKAVVTQGE